MNASMAGGRLQVVAGRERRPIGLTLLTLFDALLVRLTWREYKAKHAMDQAGGEALPEF